MPLIKRSASVVVRLLPVILLVTPVAAHAGVALRQISSDPFTSMSAGSLAVTGAG